MIVSKINPLKRLWTDTTKKIPEIIRLGKRGTKPVDKYSISTGINNKKDKIKKISDKTLKKYKGLYSIHKIL